MQPSGAHSVYDWAHCRSLHLQSADLYTLNELEGRRPCRHRHWWATDAVKGVNAELCRNPAHGDVFVSASGDKTSKVWDVRQPHSNLTIAAHAGVRCLFLAC